MLKKAKIIAVALGIVLPVSGPSHAYDTAAELFNALVNTYSHLNKASWDAPLGFRTYVNTRFSIDKRARESGFTDQQISSSMGMWLHRTAVEVQLPKHADAAVVGYFLEYNKILTRMSNQGRDFCILAPSIAGFDHSNSLYWHKSHSEMQNLFIRLTNTVGDEGHQTRRDGFDVHGLAKQANDVILNSLRPQFGDLVDLLSKKSSRTAAKIGDYCIMERNYLQAALNFQTNGAVVKYLFPDTDMSSVPADQVQAATDFFRAYILMNGPYYDYIKG